MLNQEQHDIIEELLKNKIPVKMRWYDGRICYDLEGFSKSGTVTLVPVNNEEDPNVVFICHQRYDKKSDIINLRDIIFVNYCWWMEYKDRAPFQNPHPDWIPLLTKFGYIKEKIKTETFYEPN